MVYAYDQWLPMPTKDLFDTLMMLASVNAAKDMYEKGLEEMKEFNKEYGDFLSPIDKDMLWTNDYVLQPMRDAINSMYEAGIDPLRSKEGRGLLALLRANIDTGRMARNKQSAEMAKEYLKNRDTLILKHLYDPDYEAWRLNGNTLENFDSSKGVWTESSPMPLRDVDSIVEPWVKNLEPSFDAEYTKAQNDGYDYNTVSKERIMDVINDQLPEFSKTSEGGYYRHLAELLSGGDKEAGDQLLKTWLYNRASDHTQIDRKINPEYEMRIQHKYDADIARIRANNSGNGNNPQDGGFTFKDDIYEKGLKNMIGMDPTEFLGFDLNGNAMTMMQTANNNPEFFKMYKERLLRVIGNRPGGMVGQFYDRFGINPNTEAILSTLTHTKGLSVHALAKYKKQDELKKYGDNEVEGLGLVRLTPSDVKKIYTKEEVANSIEAGLNGQSYSNGRAKSYFYKNGRFDHTVVAQTIDSDDEGIATGFANNTVTSWMPIRVYKNDSMNDYYELYIKLNYDSKPSSGNSQEFETSGISTIYDGKFDTSGQRSSGNIDEWLGVGNSELKSTAITPPF